MQNRSPYLILPLPSPNGLLMSGYRIGFGISVIRKARLISSNPDMTYSCYFNPKLFIFLFFFSLRVSVFRGEKDGKGNETSGFEQALGKSTMFPLSSPHQCFPKSRFVLYPPEMKYELSNPECHKERLLTTL